MRGLIIADKDAEGRRQLAELFIGAGYTVTVTDSAAAALGGILHRAAPIVILGSAAQELPAADLIPLLKQCDRHLTIILVADEVSLPLLRKVRRAGIFFHALKGDREELCEAVRCAYERLDLAAVNRH